ncbi:glutamine synthetase [Aureococcus anophagefferens]|uniref:Glutamine synthetase n=1 Tax=Aureococcus anophagefferens TaxID=44056 RepID=A0ABR1G063_AURAN
MIAARALARRAAPLRSYMTASELRAGVAAGDVETVMVMMHDLYGRPMGKLFDADFFLADALGHGTHACNYLAAVDMAMDPVDGYAGFGYAEGYGDFHLAPDLATLRACSWREKTALVQCDVRDGATGAPVAVAPRSVLRSQVDAVDAAGLGGANVASELEYFIYADSYKAAHAKGHSNLEPIGQYVEDYHLLQGARTEFYHRRVRRALKAAGMVVETSKGEAAKGQHELNVRYDGALAMADNHVVFKQCLKEIADQENISVTFMAKPSADEPGSSFYAPTVNAYKRYQSKSWAPTALVWSADNRTAGFRVVGSGEALRVEMRIPGADANPYLAFAAVLASGLAGVRAKLEPPAQFVGDAYSTPGLPLVPTTLKDASAAFKASAFARGAFGDVVVDHYATFFDNEVLAFERAVTDFEMRRYFEQI